MSLRQTETQYGDQCAHPLNWQDDLKELWDQIRFLRKELKGKVSRHQFITSLGGKLSISDITSVAALAPKKNENHNTLNQPTTHLTQSDLKELKAELGSNLDEAVNSLRLTLEADLDSIKENQRRAQEEERQMMQKMEQIERQISEMEGYAYGKADRSELNKLFTLNELLVIEIEQAKKVSQDLSRQLNKTYPALFLQAEKRYQELQRLNQQSQKRLRNDLSHFQEEVDRVLELLELRESETEQHRQREGHHLAKNHEEIIGMKEKLNKLELDNRYQLRDLLTRVSVIQLKENQISRAAKEVDSMRDEMELMRLDFLSVSDRVDRACGQAVESAERKVVSHRDELVVRMDRELEVTCEQIMRKVIQMTGSFVTSSEQEEEMNKIRRQIFRIESSQEQLGGRMRGCLGASQALRREFMEFQDLTEGEIQKTEQQVSKISQKMEQMVPKQQMNELFQTVVTCQELKEIAKKIDVKITQQLKRALDDQMKVNEVLCSETIVAKWFWSSGKLKGGNLVTWDKQIVNTLPENFRWKQEQTAVVIASSGYYQVQFGFYSKKKPTVQLIVNGQTVVSAVNSSSYVVHHSSGKLKEVGNSDVSGLTYIDYLLVPEAARLAVSYMGEFTGQGFLILRRV